jgi:hypothetical protein
MIPIRTLLIAFTAVAVPVCHCFAEAVPPPDVSSPDALAMNPTWTPAAPEDVRAQAFAWLDGQKPDEATRAKADLIWSAESGTVTGTELLARLAVTFALVDERARDLIALCSKPRTGIVKPDLAWLIDEKTPPLVADNLRLLFGQWLAQQAMFDEALEQLVSLEPENVVDPASLLFYQAVSHYRLLEKDAGMDAIDRLLEGVDQSPRRYVAIARLMRNDLENLAEDTLDHIARRMRDVERRLDLGRAGEKVRKTEDGIIESLDKLIKKLEEQQGCGCGGNQLQPSSPAPDSKLLGGKGQGNIGRRKIQSEGGWGNLPPKQREEALQQIGREFPSHYRDIIEQYFRKLANEDRK